MVMAHTEIYYSTDFTKILVAYKYVIGHRNNNEICFGKII